jgi:hypothetical protein
MAAAVTSPNGAPITHGKGIDAVRAYIERAGDHARSLGATRVPLRKVADAYLHEIEKEHIGYEVIEEPAKKAELLVALSEQASMKACLEKLATTPLLKKKQPAVHVIQSDLTTIADAPLLYAACEIALGLRRRPKATATLQAETIERSVIESEKRSWWSRGK